MKTYDKITTTEINDIIDTCENRTVRTKSVLFSYNETRYSAKIFKMGGNSYKLMLAKKGEECFTIINQDNPRTYDYVISWFNQN